MRCLARPSDSHPYSRVLALRTQRVWGLQQSNMQDIPIRQRWLEFRVFKSAGRVRRTLGRVARVGDRVAGAQRAVRVHIARAEARCCTAAPATPASGANSCACIEVWFT